MVWSIESRIFFGLTLVTILQAVVCIKLMRIELINRECHYLRLFLIPRLWTNVVSACYMISMKHDARCIALDWKTTVKLKIDRKIMQIDKNSCSMHRQYNKFNGVHVYL